MHCNVLYIRMNYCTLHSKFYFKTFVAAFLSCAESLTALILYFPKLSYLSPIGPGLWLHARQTDDTVLLSFKVLLDNLIYSSGRVCVCGGGGGPVIAKGIKLHKGAAFQPVIKEM